MCLFYYTAKLGQLNGYDHLSFSCFFGSLPIMRLSRTCGSMFTHTTSCYPTKISNLGACTERLCFSFLRFLSSIIFYLYVLVPTLCYSRSHHFYPYNTVISHSLVFFFFCFVFLLFIWHDRFTIQPLYIRP